MHVTCNMYHKLCYTCALVRCIHQVPTFTVSQVCEQSAITVLARLHTYYRERGQNSESVAFVSLVQLFGTD